MSLARNKTFLVSIVLLFGILAGIVVSARISFIPRAVSSQLSFDLEKAVENVSAKVGKAVVSISTERIQKVSSRYYVNTPFGASLLEDEFFSNFFNGFFGKPPDSEIKQQGLGSGVIIDREGNILTNEHVVAQADKITVTLSDGRVFNAKIKGTDTRSDIAVIKIEGQNFPCAELGNSDTLKIGQWVVAIGNPFGYAISNPEPTVTVGVVSALHRSLGKISPQERDYGDLIQTDAAINPGNSGGPLVNLKGEIIGINAAIFSTSGGYQGVSFAIPINSAKRIASSLILGKKVVYGWLGIVIQDFNKLNANAAGPENGVLVAGVVENGPGRKAGIKEGDIIIKFAGKDIKNVSDLLNAVKEAQVGNIVSVDYIRNKTRLSVKIKVEERQENLLTIALAFGARVTNNFWRGIKIAEITPEFAVKYNIRIQGGVVITEVAPNSEAEEAGLMQGDIIIEINRNYINSFDTYSILAQNVKGDCLIRTLRGFFVVRAKQ